MQILESGEFRAHCAGRAGTASIDLLLVGRQPVGTWLLTFLGTAREVIDGERAAAIDAALAALDAAGQGATDFDAFFADLNRQPQLPDFLRTKAP